MRRLWYRNRFRWRSARILAQKYCLHHRWISLIDCYAGKDPRRLFVHYKCLNCHYYQLLWAKPVESRYQAIPIIDCILRCGTLLPPQICPSLLQRVYLSLSAYPFLYVRRSILKSIGVKILLNSWSASDIEYQSRTTWSICVYVRVPEWYQIGTRLDWL